jgi:Secretion system C-terminal sorting domain/Reeler domain
MIKKTNLLYTALLIGGWFLLTNNAGGPNSSNGGGNYSGATGATCSACHGGGSINGSLTVSSNVPSNGYVGGQTYTITVSLSDPEMVVGGLNLTAVNSSNTPVGTFTASATTQTFDGGASIEHGTPEPATAGNVTWEFDWTAPTSSPTNITFYCAANAANGTGGTGGDAIYTHITAPVALPIELISFEATKLNEKNKLVWRTGEADNFSHFLVEKSSNGSLFKVINRVAYDANINQYDYIDNTDNQSDAYYRLQMIDHDGRTKESKIIFLSGGKKSIYSLYPNPAKDILTLQNNENAENNLEKIIAFDEFGRVFSLNIAGEKIDVSTLPNGVYFLLVGEKTTTRFVVMR